MATLREAAAAWVEAGRWLATCEILGDQIRRLDQASPKDRERHAEYIIETPRDMLQEYERIRERTRARAEQLMAELEHPGAALARRLLASWHGARAAWRGTR